MVNKAKLDQMLSNLQQYVKVLKDLSQVGRDSFLDNIDKIGNAKYHFVVAIECCVDIANHIISSENLRFPKENADSFVVLIENDILNKDFEENLRAMAGFRNRLVHLYWDVDEKRVYEYLQESLPDLEHFAQAIAQHEW